MTTCKLIIQFNKKEELYKLFFFVLLEYTLTLKGGTRERCRDEPRDAISYALLVKELTFINYNEFCDKEYSCSFSFSFTYSTKKEVKENEFLRRLWLRIRSRSRK